MRNCGPCVRCQVRKGYADRKRLCLRCHAEAANGGVRPLCRHCNQRYISQGRGLCWRCAHTPGVRDMYPIGDRAACARRGVADSNGARPLPPPTGAEPGSEAKLAVLEERARLGMSLWAPGDHCRDLLGRAGEFLAADVREDTD